MEIAVTVIGSVLVLSQGFVLRQLHRIEVKLDGQAEKIAAVDKELAVHIERGHQPATT